MILATAENCTDVAADCTLADHALVVPQHSLSERLRTHVSASTDTGGAMSGRNSVCCCDIKAHHRPEYVSEADLEAPLLYSTNGSTASPMRGSLGPRRCGRADLAERSYRSFVLPVSGRRSRPAPGRSQSPRSGNRLPDSAHIPGGAFPYHRGELQSSLLSLCPVLGIACKLKAKTGRRTTRQPFWSRPRSCPVRLPALGWSRKPAPLGKSLTLWA
jgi:hypothetical protein